MSGPAAVSILVPEALASEPSVAWAIEALAEALARRDIAVATGSAPGGGVVIEVAVAGSAASFGDGFPETPEGMALLRKDDRVLAWGHDVRGIVYALTELADRADHATGDALFSGAFPLVEKPTARIRSMARLYCAEEEDRGWYNDRQQWRDYLSMLVSNRFNRFALTLGMGYNYPYYNAWVTDVYFLFPYPFLFDLDGYDIRVKELSKTERDSNLEMLKFIGREAKLRGLDFQLALWTQRYDFDDSPRARHTVEGVTDENLAPYCRDALTRLLNEVPEISGLTFRVHVEGGIAEGDYAFWEQAFAGVAAAGRPVEIDMHGKGLDHRTIDIARKSGMPVTASPKYLAEHMGPPYHQSAIRDLEYPPEAPRSAREQLSTGVRKFLRYSYGDLLTKDKDYSVLYRIWPGTQRVLLWGDPEFAAGYGRSSMFAGSDGVEWCEPLSFKGRMGTGIPGQRHLYQKYGMAPKQDWQKYAYQYRVWGRLLYNPDAPRESWMRWLEAECGEAAEACERGLSLASRVLPLVTLTHGHSASNNIYWPEVYSNLSLIGAAGSGRNYHRDTEQPARFGNTPTFDSMLFANAREYVDLLRAGETCARYTPLDVADWLDGLADGCDAALAEARRSTDFSRAEVQRITVDVQILAGIARYFAERFRAACWAELFLASKVWPLIEPVIDHATRAVRAWEAAAAASRGVYPDDMTFGPESWIRGSWHARLPEMQAELLDLEAMRSHGGTETAHPDAATEAAAAALRARRPTRSGGPLLEAGDSFQGGKPLPVRLRAEADGEPVLHYRRVNQAERWKSTPMRRNGDGYVAEIPADYTASDFHLQMFATLGRDGGAVIVPGLAGNLANEPYLTVLQD